MLTQVICKEKARAQNQHQIHTHLGNNAIVILYYSLIRNAPSAPTYHAVDKDVVQPVRIIRGFRRIVVLGMYLNARPELWRCPRDVAIAVARGFTLAER